MRWNGWKSWDYTLDALGHYLLPRVLRRPICDWFERRLGVPEDHTCN